MVSRALISPHAARRHAYREHLRDLRRAQRLAAAIPTERRKKPRPVRPWSEIPLLREERA